MPRALGDLSLDEYVETTRSHDRARCAAMGSFSVSPGDRGRRRLRAAAKAAGLAACVVFAFVAGIEKERKGKHDVAPMANSILVEPTNWPTGVVDQRNAVTASMRHTIFLVDQMHDIASARPTAAEVVRVYALTAMKNTAVQCIQHLRDCVDSGHPRAQEMIDKLSLALTEPR